MPRMGSHWRDQVAKGPGIPATLGGATAVEFKRIEPDVAINDINQPTLVERHVVALRCRTPARGLGNEIADFARGRWVCNVDNAQAGAEPHCKYERPGMGRQRRQMACEDRQLTRHFCRPPARLVSLEQAGAIRRYFIPTSQTKDLQKHSARKWLAGYCRGLFESANCDF